VISLYGATDQGSGEAEAGQQERTPQGGTEEPDKRITLSGAILARFRRISSSC